MLNYVWIALIVLGIGTAVTVDIENSASNKFKNNIPFHTQIEIISNQGKAINGTIFFTKDELTNFFKEKNSSDYSASISIKLKDNQTGSFVINVKGKPPKIISEMAKASGKEEDLTGKIKINNFSSESLANVELIFEEISFIKLKEVTNSALDYAGTAVNISLGLIGIMALWLGIMKIAEEAGLIRIIANWLKPITKKLFPDVPHDHPAMGSMIMNISANMLGLGNAATPFGLKAMEELNELNPNKDTATNAMCTFLAINTAGMTLIPATAIAVRAAAGSTEPAIIIGTSLFASFCATVMGLTSAKILEKFSITNFKFNVWIKNSIKNVLSFFLIAALIVTLILTGAFGLLFSFLSPDLFKSVIQLVSTFAIPLLIVTFIGFGVVKKVNVYEQFIEGAKEGFKIAVRIIPYLVAMLVAIGIFRSGGAMDWLVIVLKPVTSFIGMPAEALPMALMRPLSGSGSLGIMAEIISVHGPDSFIGILVSTFFGSTETTFYVLAVYFGSVNIKKTRHALPAGLIADVAGILAALFIVKLLFG